VAAGQDVGEREALLRCVSSGVSAAPAVSPRRACVPTLCTQHVTQSSPGDLNSWRLGESPLQNRLQQTESRGPTELSLRFFFYKI